MAPVPVLVKDISASSPFRLGKPRCLRAPRPPLSYPRGVLQSTWCDLVIVAVQLCHSICCPKEIPRTILMGLPARIFRGRRPLARPLNAVRPSSHLMVLQSPSIAPDIILRRDGFVDPDTLLEWLLGLTGTHYSKSQIFVQKFNFDKTIQFSREIKVVNSWKVQNLNSLTSFLLPKKIDNFF